MSSQATAKQFFLRWVAALDETKLSLTDKKLVNILATNFNALAGLGTAGGKRAVKLGELIKAEGDVMPVELSNITASLDHAFVKIDRLMGIEIGPFRGFSSSEKFSFEKRFTFLYGPNGSGKSSFCEALEYALLGSIEEADSKKIPLAGYLKNVQKKAFSPPSLTVRFMDGAESKFSSPDPSFRFCFIEKNRIDSFARMSATSAKDQLDRISSLFGLDSYNEFVNGFTNDFDDRYLSLRDPSSALLERENAKVIANKARLLQIGIDQKNVVEEAKKLAMQLAPLEFHGLKELKRYLVGEDGVSGKIAELQGVKVKAIDQDADVSITRTLVKCRKSIAELFSTLHMQLLEIGQLSAQMGFRQLYLSIRAIHEGAIVPPDVCPACQTPLLDVTANPFELAKQELVKMEALTRLQDAIKITKINLIKAIVKQNSATDVVNKLGIKLNLSAMFPLLTEIGLGEIDDISFWEKRLSGELLVMDMALQEITTVDSKIASRNAALALERSERIKSVALLESCTKVKEAADQLIAKNNVLKIEAGQNEAGTKILELGVQTIKDGAKKSTEEVSRNLEFQKSYYSLVKEMRLDCETLGGKLAQGLAERAVEFYNMINGLDPEFEKLQSLQIPTASGGKILIRFRGDAAEYDALQIMSEGHLKCLGLALLLSKIVADDLRFIVYDDIVNAIDDNHRDGIASLMVGSEFLRDRQQIVTCHGEIFINKLNQKLGVSNVNSLVKEYRFLPVDRIEERGVKMMLGESLHYLAQAEENLNKNQLKDAAGKCRQSIEGIAEKLWRKMAKNISLNLTVKLRRPGGVPDLDSVITALNKELKSIVFESEENIRVNLLALQDQYNWALLNKGTHEDGSIPEFDRSDVTKLVSLLKKIDGQCNDFKAAISA